MTSLSGNKGEWSEIYTLFKLLGEGILYAGDGELNKINDLFYPIVSIIRRENTEHFYSPDTDRKVVVVSGGGEVLTKIPMSRFLTEADNLLTKIKMSKARSFSVVETESFMTEISCTQLKASHNDKSDIHKVIHDLRTGMKPELGFSIKSQLGSQSTLLNASRSTNIIYKLSQNLSQNQCDMINKIDSQSERMKLLKGMGVTLSFDCMEQKIFGDNLSFIDCGLPSIVAECLKIYFTDNVSDLKEVLKILVKTNPLNSTFGDLENFYSHKIKQLLLDVALGMMPAKLWDGRYDANGGYLVVRKDGEIVCFHFYNRNDVEDYLFNNTRLERASRDRHNYGYVYVAADGNCRLALNLQIRFK